MHKESTEFTRRVPSLQGEYRMYKESTERDHASAPTLAPHSNFPAKVRTPLHPICSSPPTPPPLRSSPPPKLRSSPHPNRSSSSSALPPPSTLSTHPRPHPAHSALFPTQTIFFVFSISPTLPTNSPTSSTTPPTLSPTNEERSRAFLAMVIEWIDEKGICKQ